MDHAAHMDELIADLYESVFLPERIPDVLLRINDLLDCDGMHLVGKDERTHTMFASIIVGEKIAVAERDYLSYFYHIDPRLELARASPVGHCIACHDFLDDKFVRSDEFYQDFLIPNGPRYVIGGNIFRTRSQKNIHVAFNHLVGRPRFEGQKRASVSRMMFHLTRWARRLVEADDFRHVASAGFYGLESLGQGVVVLDDAQRVLYCSRLAEQWIGDLVSSRGFRKSHSMRHDFRHVASKVSRSRVAETVRLRQPVDARMMQLQVTIMALPREQGIENLMPSGLQGLSRCPDVAGEGHAAGAWPRASVLMLVTPDQRIGEGDSEIYRHAFGLTEVESGLAWALVRGLSPSEYAKQRGVKISTVRTQIRSLLHKTGASRMSDLVQLLSRLPHTRG